MKFLGIKKRSWKKILTVGVSVLLVVGAVMGCVALFGKDTRTISSREFVRGSINHTEGKYVESSTSIYTRDAFPCQGLRIVPDFESSGEFEVFYYDANGRLMGTSGVQKDTYESDFPEASSARVVYTPAKPEDVKKDEWSIGYFEVNKYAKNLTITVNKEQTEYNTSSDLYVAEGTTGAFNLDDISQLNTNMNVQASELISLDGTYDMYRIYFRYTEVSSENVNVAFGDDDGKAVWFDEDGKAVSAYAATLLTKDMVKDGWYSVIVEVPEGATSLRVQGPVNGEYRIYGVQPK